MELLQRDFFKDPFNRKEIEELLQGKPASEMFNFRSPNFKRTGLTRETLSNDQLIDMMLKEPRLVRRPVVRLDARVHFGADRKALETLIG